MPKCEGLGVGGVGAGWEVVWVSVRRTSSERREFRRDGGWTEEEEEEG